MFIYQYLNVITIWLMALVVARGKWPHSVIAVDCLISNRRTLMAYSMNIKRWRAYEKTKRDLRLKLTGQIRIQMHTHTHTKSLVDAISICTLVYSESCTLLCWFWLRHRPMLLATQHAYSTFIWYFRLLLRYSLCSSSISSSSSRSSSSSEIYVDFRLSAPGPKNAKQFSRISHSNGIFITIIGDGSTLFTCKQICQIRNSDLSIRFGKEVVAKKLAKAKLKMVLGLYLFDIPRITNFQVLMSLFVFIFFSLSTSFCFAFVFCVQKMRGKEREGEREDAEGWE